MFQTIRFSRYSFPDYYLIYQLIDFDFQSEFMVREAIGVPHHSKGCVGINIAAGIETEYKKRNFDIVTNIVQYYTWLMPVSGLSLKEIVDINYSYWPTLSKQFYGKYLKHLCRNLI